MNFAARLGCTAVGLARPPLHPKRASHRPLKPGRDPLIEAKRCFSDGEGADAQSLDTLPTVAGPEFPWRIQNMER